MKSDIAECKVMKQVDKTTLLCIPKQTFWNCLPARGIFVHLLFYLHSNTLIKNGNSAVLNTGVCQVIRLSRAGRKKAIVEAIRQLDATKKLGGYTRGEICRKMGITSQSKIRDILHEMVRERMLMSGTSAIDGYQDELEIFILAPKHQTSMFDDPIVINGKAYSRENASEVSL